MKIELRNIKFHPGMSEETNCFEAMIYIDGAKACRVSNHGTGGPNEIENLAVQQRMDAYAKTLPRKTSTLIDESDPTGHFTYQPDAESIVDDLLEDWIKENEAKKERAKFERDLKSRALYTVQGKKGIFQSRKLTPAEFAKFLPNVETAHRTLKGSDQILNLLPTAKAWEIFQANITRVVR